MPQHLLTGQLLMLWWESRTLFPLLQRGDMLICLFERLVEAGAELGLGLNLGGRTQASQLSERSNLTPEDFINSEDILEALETVHAAARLQSVLLLMQQLQLKRSAHKNLHFKVVEQLLNLRSHKNQSLKVRLMTTIQLLREM